jgi:hypothetical protein
MASRLCLVALSLLFTGTSAVVPAADWQQCRTMPISQARWTGTITQNALPMMSMLSQAAMDQAAPPGGPMGQGGPMSRMDGAYPPGGPAGPMGPPMAQTKTCTLGCEISWGPFPWGAYGVCEGGTRTCTTCRTVIIDGKRSEFCEIETEPCGRCTRTSTW